jgi:5,10-methylenetetrahydromethanopterin reductase
VSEYATNSVEGARRAGRRPEEIDIASVLPCSVAANRQEAFDTLRPVVAFYAGFFPRLSPAHSRAGLSRSGASHPRRLGKGDQAGVARAVPDTLIATVAVAGTPTECRERIEAYRRSGIALPIIFPVLCSTGPAGKQDV